MRQLFEVLADLIQRASRPLDSRTCASAMQPALNLLQHTRSVRYEAGDAQHSTSPLVVNTGSPPSVHVEDCETTAYGDPLLGRRRSRPDPI